MSGDKRKDIELSVKVKTTSIIKTKSGEEMAFVLVQDDTGIIECIIFPAEFRIFKSDIFEGASLFIVGWVNLAENPRKLFPSKVKREAKDD